MAYALLAGQVDWHAIAEIDFQFYSSFSVLFVHVCTQCIV